MKKTIVPAPEFTKNDWSEAAKWIDSLATDIKEGKSVSLTVEELIPIFQGILLYREEEYFDLLNPVKSLAARLISVEPVKELRYAYKTFPTCTVIGAVELIDRIENNGGKLDENI